MNKSLEQGQNHVTHRKRENVPNSPVTSRNMRHFVNFFQKQSIETPQSNPISMRLLSALNSCCSRLAWWFSGRINTRLVRPVLRRAHPFAHTRLVRPALLPSHPRVLNRTRSFWRHDVKYYGQGGQ